VASSQEGEDYVIATGRGVLYLGGFSGQDRVETPESLTRLVVDGELRFIYMGGGRGPGGGQSGVASWVTATCTPVQVTGSAAQGGGQGAGRQAFGRGMVGSLYDCGAGS